MEQPVVTAAAVEVVGLFVLEVRGAEELAIKVMQPLCHVGHRLPPVFYSTGSRLDTIFGNREHFTAAVTLGLLRC
jgi:hypothetical protein